MRTRTRNTAAAAIATGIAVVGAAGLVHADPASADSPTDLVRNGSFESPAAPSPGLVGNFPEIPGWVETTGRGMEVQNELYRPPDGGGAQYVELDSRGPSSFFQDVATTEGRAYRLTFRYTARPNTPAAENAFEVTFGETTQNMELAPVSTPEWQTSNIDIVATQPTTRLTFADSTGPDQQRGLGALLDLVSVVPLG
jgi:hypothetical protein